MFVAVNPEIFNIAIKTLLQLSNHAIVPSSMVPEATTAVLGITDHEML